MTLQCISPTTPSFDFTAENKLTDLRIDFPVRKQLTETQKIHFWAEIAEACTTLDNTKQLVGHKSPMKSARFNFVGAGQHSSVAINMQDDAPVTRIIHHYQAPVLPTEP